jgi:heterokaryon incompatibility protein (HET)
LTGFRLTEDFPENKIPPYVILSHTWHENNEAEVTFQDVQTLQHSGFYSHKPGWEKLRVCANLASIDGYRYFWIDTCAINKSDLVELTRSINSMFSWYSKASICYVYLSDVFSGTAKAGPSLKTICMPQFQRSRWFTRGWTLQELLAPNNVRFYSMEGVYLGSKISLVREISQITSIPVAALSGNIAKYTPWHVISWGRRRNTTKAEDKAYCLLGLCDVSMAVIEGEGDKAFFRLHFEIERREKMLMQLYSWFFIEGFKAGVAFEHSWAPPWWPRCKDCFLPGHIGMNCRSDCPSCK